jgi:SAM-dependent methyltransferase
VLSKLKSLFIKKDTSNQVDEGTLLYSTDILGFTNREIQGQTYAKVASLIPQEESVLDFGCGRGDYFNWYGTTYGPNIINYTGVDIDKSLINAGKELYKDIKLINKDWKRLPNNIVCDWSININSNNYQYQKKNKDNITHLHETIDVMYKHANKGIIILLASDIVDNKIDWIKYNPGKVLNWARSKYKNVIIDHSSFMNSFILVIYKNKN